MAQLKITAVEGLRTESPDAWKDFYSDDDKPQQSKANAEKTETETENETELETESAAYEDDFEEVNNSSANVNQNTEESHSLRYASTEHLDKAGNDNSTSSNNKQKKKSKPKKPKTHSDNKPPPLNLYHNHIRDQLNHSRRGRTQPQDTMSDQGVAARRRGRKLNRRAQMKKYHSMEQAVEQAGRERLEQKFVELEELLNKPLMAGKRPMSASRAVKMVNLHHTHGEMVHREVVSSRSRVGAWMEGTVQEEEDGQEENQAYSTIRVLQTVGPDIQVACVKNNPNNSSPHSSDAHQHGYRSSPRQSRLATKPPIPGRRKKGSVDTSPTSSSGGSQHRKEGERKENGLHSYFSSDEEEGGRRDVDNVSPNRTDMHLKNSDNPKLKEWLKRKDTEYRQARKAERIKKREERNDKMIEQELKIARREKSAERVKQWMEAKRKEAIRRQKETRRRQKQEAEQQAKIRAKSPCGDGVLGSRVERPQSAPARPVKKYIPVQRPDSAVEARSKLDNGDGSAPKPPHSKFVYKRPVSGRVRLMKMQNAMKANEREAEQKRVEELSSEEKEKRARTSYDAWLIAKRKEDVEKRREAKRQKELIKSDPEMERIVPELARRRIEKIKNGKKSIDTGMRQIDNDANNRFGGGNFGEGQQPRAEEGQDQGEPVTPGHPSYKLEVTGEGASLLEFNTRARPATAKARMPIPQKAFSPRRPQSAKVSRSPSPKVRTVMDVDHSKEPNPFSLPFPESKGCPEHVRRVQERIFSPALISQSNNESQRPEPQGCDSGESGSFPKGVDESQSSKSEPRTSMVLLQELEAAALEEAQNSFVNIIKNVAAAEKSASGEVSSPGEPTAVESSPPEQAFADESSPEEASAGEMSAEQAPTSKTSQEQAPTDEISAEEIPADQESPSPEESPEQMAEAEDAAEEEEDGELKQEEQEDEDAEKVEEEDEEKAENEGEEEDVMDGYLGEDSDQQKLESAAEDEEMTDAALENQEEPEKEEEPEVQEEQISEEDAANENADDQTDSHPQDDNNNTGDNKDTETDEKSQEKNEEVEDTPRRLGKHVSFSEDLTVYEPGSTEASSNFEDERGDDYNDDGCGDFKSLDDIDMPDP